MRPPPLANARLASLTMMILVALSGCVEKVPESLVESINTLDARLREAQAREYAGESYVRFVNHWVAVKTRILQDDEEIVWPWEANPLIAELEQLQREGEAALATSHEQRDARKRETESRLALIEGRLRALTSHVEQMGSRIVLGQKPVETALLVHQARSFYEQGLYARSAQLTQQASRLMHAQATVLSRELGHYADERQVTAWRRLAQSTVEWSRSHQAAAIVVSKADKHLLVYRNGRPVGTYVVRLGYNGMLEKRYQGDGATPEGRYRVVRKKDRGQTQFYKALLLDYPNTQDRGRFEHARRAGRLPPRAYIGGHIEIHGMDNPLLSQTLGCVMLENADMDRLFAQVEVGTPVTIVGALKLSNPVSLALAGLGEFEEG